MNVNTNSEKICQIFLGMYKNCSIFFSWSSLRPEPTPIPHSTRVPGVADLMFHVKHTHAGGEGRVGGDVGAVGRLIGCRVGSVDRHSTNYYNSTNYYSL